jgi:hypothetical protein
MIMLTTIIFLHLASSARLGLDLGPSDPMPRVVMFRSQSHSSCSSHVQVLSSYYVHVQVLVQFGSTQVNLPGFGSVQEVVGIM